MDKKRLLKTLFWDRHISVMPEKPEGKIPVCQKKYYFNKLYPFQDEIGTVSDSSVRVVLKKNDLALKIDFVNDVKDAVAIVHDDIFYGRANSLCK